MSSSEIRGRLYESWIFSIALKLSVVLYNLELTLVFLNWWFSLMKVSAKCVVLMLFEDLEDGDPAFVQPILVGLTKDLKYSEDITVNFVVL